MMYNVLSNSVRTITQSLRFAFLKNAIGIEHSGVCKQNSLVFGGIAITDTSYQRMFLQRTLV